MIEVKARLGGEIQLARKGENLARRVAFEVSEWQRTYGAGTVALLHQRNGDRTPYPCVVTVEGDKAYWAITASDVATAGKGMAELQYLVNEVCVKSETYSTRTERALGDAGPTPPAPHESWLKKVLKAGTDAEGAAAEAAHHAGDAWNAADDAWRAKEAVDGTADESRQYRDEAKGYSDEAYASAENAAVHEFNANEAKTQAEHHASMANLARLQAEAGASSADNSARAASNAVISAENAAKNASDFAKDALDNAMAARDSAELAAEYTGAADSRLSILEEQMKNMESGGDLAPRVETLESKVADLLYEPIALVAKSIDPATVENGQSVRTATLSWTLNKEPARIRLDSEEITPTKTGTMTVEVGKYTGWSLIFWDERNASVNWMPIIAFLNGIYYGAAAAPEAINSAFVLGLEKKVLSNAKGRTITVNAEDGEYIWYCLPASINKANSCVFKVGGFEGGFDLVDTTAITNSHGYTENYCIYRSARAGLGETTVEVS